MHRAARLSAILERLADGGSVAVADLADDLDASPATIRRDLVILEQQRLLARTHGGAIAHAVSYELPLRYKGVRYADEKRRIARQAATYVSEGMAVGLTGGTTATEVARAIADQQKLTIVTNALNIASELAVRPRLKLISTGGVVRSQSYELSGPIAEASLTGLLVLAEVNSSQAVLATLTYRIASYWVPLLAGPIAYGLFKFRYRNKPDAGLCQSALVPVSLVPARQPYARQPAARDARQSRGEIRAGATSTATRRSSAITRS